MIIAKIERFRCAFPSSVEAHPPLPPGVTRTFPRRTRSLLRWRPTIGSRRAMSNAYEIIEHSYDVIIGAGLPCCPRNGSIVRIENGLRYKGVSSTQPYGCGAVFCATREEASGPR